MARTKNGFIMSKKKIETKLKNDQTFSMYFHDLRQIAETSFLYEDLPDTINISYMERIHLRSGDCCGPQNPLNGDCFRSQSYFCSAMS